MKKRDTLVWFLVGIVFYLPFAYLLLLSLATQWRYPLLLPESLTGSAWSYVTHNTSGMAQSFYLSFALSLAVAFASSLSGFMVGKTIASLPNKNQFLRLSYFPYAFSPVIYGFCIYYFFIKMQLIGSVGGVFLAQFMITFPFSVILFTNHWSRDLLDMEQLVFSLGGSRMQAFRKVVLPLSKNMLLIGFFQLFLISWFEYGLTSVIGLGKVETLSIKCYQFIGEANAYYAALASVLLVFPPLILLWLNRRFVFKFI